MKGDDCEFCGGSGLIYSHSDGTEEYYDLCEFCEDGIRISEDRIANHGGGFGDIDFAELSGSNCEALL